jgi:dipeptidyl aminopeptidase/acylaminoacyl peptidase
MHDHERTLELAATAIDWPLSAADRDRLQRELAVCPSCRLTARSLERTQAAMTERALVLPSPPVDQRVTAAIATRRPPRPGPMLLLAAALSLTIVGGLMVAGGRIDLPVITFTRPSATVHRAPAPAPSGPATRAGELTVGGTAVVVAPDGVVLAAQPGIAAGSEGLRLFRGQRMAVADGPQTIGGIDWYRLSAGTLVGWAAVRDASGGRALASIGAGDIASLIATTDGHLRLRLAGPDGVERWTVDEPSLTDARNPSWSADGATLAFSARPADAGAARAVYLLQADGTGLRRAGSGDAEELWPRWNPADGRLAITRQDPSGPVVAVLDPRAGTTWTVVGQGNAPSWSADGRRLAVLRGPTDGRYRLALIDADGSQRDVTEAVFPLSRVSWSPDGTTIATIGSSASGCGVCLVDVVSGRIDRITDAVRGYPAWSADGSRLALSTSGPGGHAVAVLSLDGSVTTLANGAVSPPGAQWSPDDRWIVAATNADGSRGTIVVSTDGSGELALTSAEPVITVSWRPVLGNGPV